MNKTAYTFLITIIFCSLNANASAVTVIGGNISCGKWVEARKQNSGAYYQEYFLGFLSGLAMGLNKDFLINMDMESISLWTDNYCQSNPTDGLVRAGIMFKNERVKKNGL